MITLSKRQGKELKNKIEKDIGERIPKSKNFDGWMLKEEVFENFMAKKIILATWENNHGDYNCDCESPGFPGCGKCRVLDPGQVFAQGDRLNFLTIWKFQATGRAFKPDASGGFVEVRVSPK